MWKTCFIFLTVQICTAQNVNAFHQTESMATWDLRPLDMSISQKGRSIFEKRKVKIIANFNSKSSILNYYKKRDIRNVVQEVKSI